MNNYCGLTEEELAEVRKRHRHFVAVRVDDRTTIFIDPSRNVEKARKRFIKELRYWRLKHLNDE